MKTDPLHIIKSTVITEESTLQSETKHKYVFRVDPRATKPQVRDAVESMFPDIKVLSVNTMNYQGKLSGRRGRQVPGRRPSWKKAVVTLRPGDSIDLI
ncbi:MAG TPA: 50S ribosomal protein L23 [Candidatus Hydrogenedentes bacterium]|nr:50S ribosomal protein L23 [Candidatus Hydrogenedentota bacterium]HPG69447.1 50S ribosomal protein L23 [Candidatus Hydrogenedentota bacterium]